MEKISLILMGVALALLPCWLIVSHIFAKDSVYPQKRDWIITVLGATVFICFIASVVIELVS